MSQKKTKTQTNDRSKSKDSKKQSLNLSQQCSTLEDFEDNILDVDIKKNKTARQLFISETYENEHKGQRIVDAISTLSKKWNNLADNKKKKYEDLAMKEKERYEEHIALVRKHLIQKPPKEDATAFYIFMDEAMKTAIENLEDLKEARVKAREQWKSLSLKDKEKWEEKKEANKELYNRLRSSKPGSVNAYALWVKDQIASAKEKGNSITIKDCAEKWPKVKQEIKDKYSEYATEMREEKEKQRDLYEITFGIKPRRPLGPYNFYLQEMAKLKKFQGANFFKECSKAWKKISEKDKEKYERIAKRDRLIYMVKKMEFNSYKRSNGFKRAPSAFNLYLAETREKMTDVDNKTAFQTISNKWAKESDKVKQKFKKLADEAKKDNEQDRDDYMNRVYDNPKRPRSGYQIFLSERMPTLKEKNGDTPTSELFKKIAEEWNAMKEDKKEKYNKAAEPGREAYKSKMKEFDRLGYYVMDEAEKEAKSQKKEARSQKSKSPAKSKSKKKKD